MSNQTEVEVVVASFETLTNPEKAAQVLLHAKHAVERMRELKEGAEHQAVYFLNEKVKLESRVKELEKQLEAFAAATPYIPQHLMF